MSFGTAGYADETIDFPLDFIVGPAASMTSGLDVAVAVTYIVLCLQCGCPDPESGTQVCVHQMLQITDSRLYRATGYMQSLLTSGSVVTYQDREVHNSCARM